MFCCGKALVSEQRPNEQKRLAAGCWNGGIRMPKIVKTHVFEPSRVARSIPESLTLLEALTWLSPWKHEWISLNARQGFPK